MSDGSLHFFEIQFLQHWPHRPVTIRVTLFAALLSLSIIAFPRPPNLLVLLFYPHNQSAQRHEERFP